jgi:hypothetical protein
MGARSGICKLTGLSGHFVRCHLIPKSLTRLPTHGRHRIEAGLKRRPFGRYDGWFDEELVVTKGERILEVLDDWAVKTLRANKLIWSGWKTGERQLQTELTPADTSFRAVTGIDGSRLRMFFLSLLWRAAATNREEFSEIVLGSDDLEVLRKSICEGTLPPPKFFPNTLIQFLSRGDPHNQTPIKRTMLPHPATGLKQEPTDVLRFYFDGLIAYFYIPGTNTPTASQLGPIAVGNGEDLLVTTVPFETSWHWSNLRQMVLETEQVWPGVAMSIGRKRD